MEQKNTPYLRAEHENDSSVIMILGREVPLLVNAVSSYIKRYGGNTRTRFTKDSRIDYLIIFDENIHTLHYLSALKTGGKILHVVSHRKSASSRLNNLPTLYLPPSETYKTDVLVRKILMRLFDSIPYQPEKKKKGSPEKIPADSSVSGLKKRKSE